MIDRSTCPPTVPSLLAREAGRTSIICPMTSLPRMNLSDDWPAELDPNPNEPDLAIATDGSFVKTTSEGAARALSRYYEIQDGIDSLAVTSRMEAGTGRIIYRIRPRSIPLAAPSTPPFPAVASPVLPTSQLPALTFTTATPQKSSSQPIQSMQSTNKMEGSPSTDCQSLLLPDRQLRSATSTPSLSHASRNGLSEWRIGSVRKSVGSDDSDVLSRSFRWTTPPQLVRDGNADWRNGRDLPQDRVSFLTPIIAHSPPCKTLTFISSMI